MAKLIQYKDRFNLKSFTNFSNMLDNLCNKNSGFLSAELLEIIAICFDFEDTSISYYKNKNFKGIILNDSTPDLVPHNTDIYVTMFQSIDPFAKSLGNLPECNKKGNAIRSSHFLSDCEQYQIYLDILKNYGLKWSAALVFGDFRLTIHKRPEDKNFTDSEMENLNYLGNLIYNKSKEYYRSLTLKDALKTRHNFLNSLNIGSLIVDSDYNLIDYNDKALLFITEITNNPNIISACKDLLNMFGELYGFDSLQGDIFFSGKAAIGNYNINLITNFLEGSFGVLNKSFYIEITNKDEGCLALSENKDQRFSKKYSLTNREMEIINLVCEGKTYQDIADTLFISICTVRTHIKHIYSKMCINNQRMLISTYDKFI